LLSEALIDSAVEHRMWGLLHSWADEAGKLVGPEGARLTSLDTQQWARNRLLTATAGRVTAVAGSLGLPVAFIKGVTFEAQIYARQGERPTTDLDIVVAPGHAIQVVDLVETLYPDHRWLPNLHGLITGGHIQSIDLVTDGIPIDLHLDPLKLEIVDARHPEALWERTTMVEVAGTPLPCFDMEVNLALALLHLNKDRFCYLLGYADVARLLDRIEDWSWIDALAVSEGLTTPMMATLATVTEELGIPADRVPSLRGLRGGLWRVLWPERIRLMGAPGRVRYRYRQMFIPVTGTGRISEVARGWLKRVFPPQALLDAYYPDVKGPYPWKLVAARLTRRSERRRRRKMVMDADQRSSSAESAERRT
jgi:hypothetical protein